MNTLEAEILYDLTWNLAYDTGLVLSGVKIPISPFKAFKEFSDSRERFEVLMAWTQEFMKLHEGTDWNTTDYIDAIDTFYEQKSKELLV